MNNKPVTAGKLLKLAVTAPDATIDKMAHALGWPDTFQLSRGGHFTRTKWANPYRNGYLCTATDADWRWAKREGLAVVAELISHVGPNSYWTVTPLGMQVTRLRLEAVRRAYRFVQ